MTFFINSFVGQLASGLILELPYGKVFGTGVIELFAESLTIKGADPMKQGLCTNSLDMCIL